MKNIVEENRIKIQSIIKRFTGKFDEDLEQEIFLRIWKKLDTYKEQNKFSAWVCTLSKNICKDFLKSKAYKTAQAEVSEEYILENTKGENEPEKLLDKKLRQKLILKAIDNLPKKSREVIILYEFEGYSYEEISKKIKVPEGTIKSRLFNARKILAEQLQELIGD